MGPTSRRRGCALNSSAARTIAGHPTTCENCCTGMRNGAVAHVVRLCGVHGEFRAGCSEGLQGGGKPTGLPWHLEFVGGSSTEPGTMQERTGNCGAVSRQEEVDRACDQTGHRHSYRISCLSGPSLRHAMVSRRESRMGYGHRGVGSHVTFDRSCEWARDRKRGACPRWGPRLLELSGSASELTRKRPVFYPNGPQSTRESASPLPPFC